MSDKPNIANLAGKVRIFERRLDYLEKKIADRTRSEGELNWDMAEVSAIRLALSLIEWYRDDLDGTGVLDLLERVSRLDVDDVAAFLELQREIRQKLEEIEDD